MTTHFANIIEDLKKDIKSQEDLSISLTADMHNLKEKLIYYKNMNKLLENNSKIIKLKVKNLVDSAISNQNNSKNQLCFKVETLFSNYSLMNKLNSCIMKKIESVNKPLKELNQEGLGLFNYYSSCIEDLKMFSLNKINDILQGLLNE